MSKLFGTVATLRAGDVWADWLDGYARRHAGWKRTISPILLVPWNGEPFQVKGEQFWPGAAVSHFGSGEALHLGQAARWSPALTGSGNAMHPTWVGSTLVFAVLADGSLRDRQPFSLVRADRLPIGSRMLAATSISKFNLNHGLMLGRTGEGKVGPREGIEIPGFHVYAPGQSTISGRAVKALAKALAQWRWHVRFQQGVFLTWGWQGKAADRWEAEADAALAVLSGVREAVFGADRPPTGAGIPAAVDWETLAVPSDLTPEARKQPVPLPDEAKVLEPLRETGARPVTLRYTGRTRRDASTGAIEVTRPPKLKLPRGYSGTIVRWLVPPGELLGKGQPVAVFHRDDGSEVDLLCPRIGHRVVRRCGVGAKVHDRSVVVSLERIS